MRWLGLALVGIAALVAGSVVLIDRWTEAPAHALAERPPAPMAQPEAEPPAVAFVQPQPQPPLEPAADVLIIPPADPPEVPSAVPNESPPIQGAAPVALPEDPTARQDAVSAIRRQRFADQMDRLNRRNASRGGQPATGVPPKPPPGQAPGRRGVLVSTE